MKSGAYIYISLGVLFAAFGIVSFFVFLSGGKNKYVVQKKLSIGALIIGLTCVSNGCKPVVTCYAPVVDPILTPRDSVNVSEQIVLMSDDTTLEFDCDGMYYNAASFRLFKESLLVFEDDCELFDTPDNKRLKLIFPANPGVGLYKLKIYYLSKEQLQENSTPNREFFVKIVE